MKTTKKSIKERTRSTRGFGFNPDYSFKTDINDFLFEKPVGDVCVYVTYIDKNNSPFTEMIGEADKKSEYINLIYDYLNL